VFAFLFPKGDRSRGLMELQRAATNAIMLKAESYYFLSNIYVTYENNYEQAHIYSKALHELYPANPEYLADHLRNLLLAAKYDEAESLIRSPSCESHNAFFLTQLAILNGILQEKKYKDYTEAKKYYEKGLREISAFDSYGNDYAAFACFGLSRICDINKDKQGKNIPQKGIGSDYFKALNFDK
jgi:tetratricopeptide (TPR) repeat protein